MGVTPWLTDPDVTLYHGDCLEMLRELPAGSVHMCATSPPFYGLRDYGTGEWEGGDPGCDHAPGNDSRASEALSTLGGGKGTQGHRREGFGTTCGRCGARRVDRQIGLEETPDEWVNRLVDVFREVRRVLRDDGTLWVEIGDSYASNPSKGGSGPNGKNEERWGYDRTGRDFADAKPKDLLGQPWLLAKALRDPYYAGTIKQESDRVWLAAILDGEGSINIHKRPAGQKAYSTFEKKDGTTSEYVRKADSYQPKVEITNTSRVLMDRVVAIAGGTCDSKQEAGTHGRKQTIYRWTVTADKARALLRELYPHLVAKQHEARLAYGCPSSDKDSASVRATAAAAHEALKLLHGGSTTGIDFPAPESLWEAGWYLRSEIIWAREPRPNPMPESVTDRPTKSHSTVFLLSKQPRYFWDADAIREPYDPKWQAAWERHPKNEIESNPDSPYRDHTNARNGGGMGYSHSGANARSVWTIATEPTPFAHFATWPQALVRRMILAGTSEKGCCSECGAPWVRETSVEYEAHGDAAKQNAETRANAKAVVGQAAYQGPQSMTHGRATKRTTTVGWSPSCNCDAPPGAGAKDLDGSPAPGARLDYTPIPCTVLDPFSGSGTTSLVARNHGRHSIGIELNEQYLEIAGRRLQQLSLLA